MNHAPCRGAWPGIILIPTTIIMPHLVWAHGELILIGVMVMRIIARISPYKFTGSDNVHAAFLGFLKNGGYSVGRRASIIFWA